MTTEHTRTELVWPGKYDSDGRKVGLQRDSLPFQVIERVNESRATREATKQRTPTLFDIWSGDEGDTFEDGWRNKLIWGENHLVLSSLLEQYAGRVDLIYIDPPFATGADFSFTTEIGEDDDAAFKEQSLIEEKAYRDTWRAGRDSYLPMLHARLTLLRDLLSNSGSIFVHLDVHTGPYVKILMDEIFGEDCFRNEIAWYYYNKMHDSRKRLLPKAFDQILYYVKSSNSDFTYHGLKEKRDQPVKQLRREKIDGVLKNARDAEGKVIYDISDTRTVDNVWRIRALQPANKKEWVNFETQKPVNLVERVLAMASDPGDLVLDAFVGSGTTPVAAELNDRRWIGIDMGRYAIHLTRKRLLDIEDCRPFELLNLGRYERHYWHVATFGDDPDEDGTIAVWEYIAFVLKLYGAVPAAGLQHLHGTLASAFVHVGAVDAPVTIGEINSALEECIQLQGRELHVLGWEWEMGLHDPMVEAAKARGVKLILRQIPREVMEAQAVEQGDVTFFELAYLDIEISSTGTPREYTAKLNNFVIPNPELVPVEIRSKISKWSDYVDYWAIDWSFAEDTFMQQWVTYRTRRDRSLSLESDKHTYQEASTFQVMIKVVDVFGNDTSKILQLDVK